LFLEKSGDGVIDLDSSIFDDNSRGLGDLDSGRGLDSNRDLDGRGLDNSANRSGNSTGSIKNSVENKAPVERGREKGKAGFSSNRWVVKYERADDPYEDFTVDPEGGGAGGKLYVYMYAYFIIPIH
jgi:hypothetical protein